MSKVKESKTKSVKPKKTSKKKSSTASAEKKTKAKKMSKKKLKKSFLADLLENVEQGAKLVTEKTTETYEKVKKGAAEAIDTSSQVVTDLYYSASEYTDQFKDKIEMKKLNSTKEQLFAELGKHFYRKYKIENVTFTKLSRTKKFSSLLKSIQQIDQEIVELGNKLK